MKISMPHALASIVLLATYVGSVQFIIDQGYIDMGFGTPVQQFGHTVKVSTLMGQLVVSSTQSTECSGNQTYDMSASASVEIEEEGVNMTVPAYNGTMVFNGTLVKDQVCIEDSCTPSVEFYTITGTDGDYCFVSLLGLSPTEGNYHGPDLIKEMQEQGIITE